MSDSVCPKCGLPRVAPQGGQSCACVAASERSFESDRRPAASSVVSREIHLDREHLPGRPPRRDGEGVPLSARMGGHGPAHAAESPVQGSTPAWARDASPLKKVAGAAEPAWFLSPVQSEPPQAAVDEKEAARPPVAEISAPPSPLLSTDSSRATRVFGLPAKEEDLLAAGELEESADATASETPAPPSPLLSTDSSRATRVFGLPAEEARLPAAETKPKAESGKPATPVSEAPSAPPLPPRPAAAKARPSPLPKPRPAPRAPNAVEEIHAVPAGVWERVLARVIDFASLACRWAILLFLAQSVSGIELLATSSLQRFAPWLGGLFCALTFVYAALFHALGGRTPGKWVVGIIVLDETGQPPALGRAALRALLAFVSAAPLFLGFAVAHFSRRRQAFHDKIARTYVVRLVEPRAPRSKAA
ncbi:MAG: RDD family protein [Myxococcaceae bacterium]|nr:RDD family protein [Myxococcaceae bacterium]